MLEKMSREKPSNDKSRSSSSKSSLSETSDPATKRKKSEEISGGIDRNDGIIDNSGKLSMREFFEAGGRSYEVYLRTCSSRPVSVSSVSFEENTHLAIKSPNKTNQHLTVSDGYSRLSSENLKLQVNDTESSQNPFLNSSYLTVVHITAPSDVAHQGSELLVASPLTPSSALERGRSAFIEASRRIEKDTSRFVSSSLSTTSSETATTSGKSSEDLGTTGGFRANDIIDRVITAGLRCQQDEATDEWWKIFRNLNQQTADRSNLKTFNNAPPNFKIHGDPDESPSVRAPMNRLSPQLPVSAKARSSPTQFLSSVTQPGYHENSAQSKGITVSTVAEKRQVEPDNICFNSAVIDLSCKRMNHAEVCELDTRLRLTNDMTSPRGENLPEAKGQLDSLNCMQFTGMIAQRAKCPQSATIFSDVTQWNVDQVVRYVATVPGCRDYAEIFRQEEIDGACLIRLTERHLLDVIKMKLGPAIRLLQAINSLCVHALTSSESVSHQFE